MLTLETPNTVQKTFSECSSVYNHGTFIMAYLVGRYEDNFSKQNIVPNQGIVQNETMEWLEWSPDQGFVQKLWNQGI